MDIQIVRRSHAVVLQMRIIHAFFSLHVQAPPISFAAVAPIISWSTLLRSGKDDQRIQSAGGTAAEQEQFSAALRAHIIATKGLTEAESAPPTMLLRIAAALLPPASRATASTAWVDHPCQVPAVELADMVAVGKKLMSR